MRSKERTKKELRELLEPPKLPDEIRFLTIHGVRYWVPWERMLPGDSFFLKTAADAKTVAPLLNPAEAYFNYILVAATRCEFGYYGVRVWRMY
jgi:hypothetical protein